MRYFYAKIGKSNNLFERFIHLENLGIPIFFNGASSNRKEFLIDGKAHEQGRNFFWCEDNPEKAIIISQHQGSTYFFKPNGKISFIYQADEDYTGYVKLLPVKLIAKKNNCEVPLILASISSNRYIAQRTFPEITNPGNIAAIRYCLEKDLALTDPSTCISSVELETLVAKIFEESGCFVPAYRGGVTKSIDIFAHNTGSVDINISGLIVPANSSLSIQVKTTPKKIRDMEPAPYGLLVTLNDSPRPLSDRERHLMWIKRALETLPNTKAWINQVIAWTGQRLV